MPSIDKKTTTKFKLFTGSLNQNPVKMEAKCFPCYARGCTKQFDCFKPLYISRYSDGDVYNVEIRNREHITGCRVFSTTAEEELIGHNVYNMVI